MKRLRFLLVLVSLIGVAAQAWAGPEEEVAAVAQQWGEAYRAGNLEGLLALYDQDARLWGTTSRTRLDGKEAIRGYFVAVTQRVPTREVTFGDQSIRVFQGAFAVNTGSYRFTGVTRDGQKRDAPARYSFALVKRDGRWLIVDHHSSAIPAAP